MNASTNIRSILARMIYSVRGAHYVPDITIKAKISKEVVHKLPFATFRIWPLALWPYLEHCKDLAFFR